MNQASSQIAGSTGASTGDIFTALYAGHHIGDYWAQTAAQADAKGLPGWRGRAACAAHATSMTACKVVMLAALHRSGRRISWQRAAAALAVDAASHYAADRRAPLRQLAAVVGKEPFWNLGQPRPGRDDNPSMGTGAALLDQAWHVAWLYAAALIASSR